MNKSNKTKPFLLAIGLFIPLFISYGQDILPKEQEREIKTSGKYYYSECSSFEEVDAKECALRDLTQLVLIDMIKQAIQSDEVEMKNAMEMRAQTARLNQTGRIRILAWIEKENVHADATPAQMPEPTTISEQTKTSATPSETNPKQEPEPAPVSTQTVTSETPSEPDLANEPAISTPADPVVQDLATCETFVQFRRMADGFRRQGKIVYGTNKTAFVNPEKCFVAVFTPAQKLIALLDAGQNSRVDFLTGKTIQSIEQQFAGHILYWIQPVNQ